MPPVLSRPQWIPLLPKPGTYHGHPQAGTVHLTHDRLRRYVENHRLGVYQRQLPVTFEHEGKLSGAAGWITDLRQNRDGSVDALVAWNDRGQQALREGRFRYVSPEWLYSWTDPTTGADHDVISGAALTNKPYWKDLEVPKQTSEPTPFGAQQVYATLRELAQRSTRAGQTVEQRLVELLREYPSAGQWYATTRQREQATAAVAWPRAAFNNAVKQYIETNGVSLAEAISAVEGQG